MCSLFECDFNERGAIGAQRDGGIMCLSIYTLHTLYTLYIRTECQCVCKLWFPFIVTFVLLVFTIDIFCKMHENQLDHVWCCAKTISTEFSLHYLFNAYYGYRLHEWMALEMVTDITIIII